jgi:hypothetical protein
MSYYRLYLLDEALLYSYRSDSPDIPRWSQDTPAGLVSRLGSGVIEPADVIQFTRGYILRFAG